MVVGGLWGENGCVVWGGEAGYLMVGGHGCVGGGQWLCG